MLRARKTFSFILLTSFVIIIGAGSSPTTAQGAEIVVNLNTPTAPPEWALLERELLRANTAACREFFDRYFDERGFLLCIERWGGDDGPDDAIENVNDWPLLHALGAPNVILDMYRKALEGHFRQYTLAKTTEVPFARDGMYYKEFPVMFDWQHNGEGMTVFNLQGLSNVDNPNFQKRVRRFAGFYMNEDPGAPNFDPKHRIIKSLLNGSRGPLLRKATALDWTGDPIEVENRFTLGHGERNYEEMLAHFETYNDVVGDHPLNLLATTLPLNAYMLTGDDSYLDAWRKQIDAINAVGKTVDGKRMTPRMHGDDGWYSFTEGKYDFNTREIYYLSMRAEDRERMPRDGWFEYLAGQNPEFPKLEMQADLARIRDRVRGMRHDETTPDTRLADDPMPYNPAAVTSLQELMLGGLPLPSRGGALFARVRYFDPLERRAGIPEDVAALVEKMDGESVTLSLVNVNQTEPRTVVIQAGGYAEHQFVEVADGSRTTPVDETQFTVKLAPGSGGRLKFRMRRYCNPPTMSFPWNR